MGQESGFSCERSLRVGPGRNYIPNRFFANLSITQSILAALERRGLSNSVAAVLLVVGILIGAGGYYLTTTYSPVRTETMTQVTTLPTQIVYSTLIQVSTQTRTLYVPVMSQSGSGIFYAQLSTSQGAIEVELYNNSAPKTVTNFINLAESGFYNNLVWHRIVAGFVIQTGDPNTRNGGGDRAMWGQGSSGQTVPLEINPNLHNYVGYLGMARGSDPNSGSSQFYINLANNTSLDGQYTVFGKVISGMNVVTALGNLLVASKCEYSCQCDYRDMDTREPAYPSQAMLLSVTIIDAPLLP
jgi:cyclophilin family peptidyl-prolyl cis-trans isomerase